MNSPASPKSALLLTVVCCDSIVFVHGLTGSRTTTWIYDEHTQPWPRAFLTAEIPNVRIMIFGYDADIVGMLKTAGSNTLRDHGKSLASDIATYRKLDNAVTECTP